MRTWRHGRRWLFTSATCGLLAVTAAYGQQPPEAVRQVLQYQPTQKGVAIALPTEAEQAKCTVTGDPKAKAGQAVWLLKDEKGQVLRRFVDTNGDKYPDSFSYYKDGLEVYREVDTKFSGKADRFLWLNTGGSRIGTAKAGSGVIDAWQAISLEELTQEVMKALAAKDWNRYAALLIHDEDLAKIGVAGGEADRIRKKLAEAPAKFQQVAGKFALNESSKWLHSETGNPSRLLAEATGWKHDVLIHARVMILCETAGKTEYIQLADVVQVGDTWKLLDAPMTIDMPLVAGPGLGQGDPNAAAPVDDGPLQKLLKELADVDASAPKDTEPGVNPAVVDYHRKRAAVINNIIAACPEKDREGWYKQIIDSLAASVAASDPKDNKALQTLQQYTHSLAKQAPGSEVAGYAVFRLLIIENNFEVAKVTKADEHKKVSAAFADKLTNFVKTYPNISETPEALHRLGELYEGVEKEAEAKQCYEQVVSRFGTNRLAAKAAGAIRRLTSIGQKWDVGVNVTVLNGNGAAYNAADLNGRTVVVYYWGTFINPAPDFAKMKTILQPFQAKGVVLVAVNLDDKAAMATQFLAANAATMPPSLHLHSPGGFDSPAATHYGISVFPAMFLMDASGKITSRTLDVGTLEEELKKIVK
jgi:hypothetical protein